MKEIYFHLVYLLSKTKILDTYVFEIGCGSLNEISTIVSGIGILGP